MNPTGWTASSALLLLTSLSVPNVAAAELTAQKLNAVLPELEKLAEHTQKKTGVPGMSIAVVFQDKVVYLKGFGVRQVGKGEPVDADTIFQLASVSKPITSTVLAALVGEGVCAWDDRVSDRLPGFRLYEPWVTEG